MVHAAFACAVLVKSEITVCGRSDAGERSRYMSPLPQDYAAGDPRARSVARERYDLLDYNGGGAVSCSTAGAGGMFGCGYKKHMAGASQRAGAHDPRGPLYDK